MQYSARVVRALRGKGVGSLYLHDAEGENKGAFLIACKLTVIVQHPISLSDIVDSYTKIKT